MQNTKNLYKIYLLAAVICYLACAVWFVSGNRTMGVIWLCIGSCNLSLTAVWKKRGGQGEE